MSHLPPGSPEDDPTAEDRSPAAADEVSVDVTPGSVIETVPADEGARRKRSWKSRLLELALWAAVAILTAVVLVYASDRWLPSNF